VYHVNGNGDLLGFQARFEAAPEALAESDPAALWGSVAITGEVEDGRLTLTRELSRAGGTPFGGQPWPLSLAGAARS